MNPPPSNSLLSSRLEELERSVGRLIEMVASMSPEHGDLAATRRKLAEVDTRVIAIENSASLAGLVGSRRYSD